MLGNRLNQFYLYGYESRNKELDGAWEYIRLNTTSFDRWDFISRTALQSAILRDYPPSEPSPPKCGDL